MPHRVDVRPYLGDDGTQALYDAPVLAVHCWQENVDQVANIRQVVRDASGDRVTVATVLLLARAQRARFALKSQVTLADGRVCTVEAAVEHTDGGLGAWQHLEVDLSYSGPVATQGHDTSGY